MTCTENARWLHIETEKNLLLVIRRVANDVWFHAVFYAYAHDRQQINTQSQFKGKKTITKKTESLLWWQDKKLVSFHQQFFRLLHGWCVSWRKTIWMNYSLARAKKFSMRARDCAHSFIKILSWILIIFFSQPFFFGCI